MATGFHVIPFKKDIVNAAKFKQNARTYVVEFVAEAQREFSQDYARVPPSDSYVRTGTYGRGWRGPTSLRLGPDYEAVLENRVKYAVYVGGPKGRGQSRVMARKGWSSVTDVVKRVETKQNRRYRKTLFGS